MSGSVFCFAWSEEGFECVINLTDIDKQCVMAKIADKPMPQTVSSILHMQTIRARANEHRRMEVWLLKLNDEDETEASLTAWSENEPQSLVNMVREHGECIAGKRYDRPKKIV
jgi:hypothetical protein